MLTFKNMLRILEAHAVVLEVVEDALADAMEHVLNVSNQQVPLEYGDLQASGECGVEGLVGWVSYDTPYAVSQHEDLSFYHKNGRKAKYLEDAFNSEMDKILQTVASRVKAAL